MKGLSKYVKQVIWSMIFELFHDGGRNHIETSPLICSTNQWTGFYMISTSVMKALSNSSQPSQTVISVTSYLIASKMLRRKLKTYQKLQEEKMSKKESNQKQKAHARLITKPTEVFYENRCS